MYCNWAPRSGYLRDKEVLVLQPVAGQKRGLGPGGLRRDQVEGREGEKERYHGVRDHENWPRGLVSQNRSGQAEHGKSYLRVINKKVEKDTLEGLLSVQI